MENENQTIEPEFLEEIKNKIEKINKYHQLEVLKILVKHNCKINENKR